MDREIGSFANLIGRDELRRPLGVVTSAGGRPSFDTRRVSNYPAYRATRRSPTVSNASTLGTSSRRSGRESASWRSSTSTSWSSAPSAQVQLQLQRPISNPPPWHSDPFGSMAPIDYDYQLPCEFALFDCGVVFHPERFEEWINHSLSHFLRNPPPSSTVCIFCDKPDAHFRNATDPWQNWRERMLHIGRHYQEHWTLDHARPDFFLIKHLKACGLITAEEYKEHTSWSERHPCENLVDNDFQTPEMKARSRRDTNAYEQRHDPRKENRQILKHKGKEKTHETYRPSQRPQIYQEHWS